MVKAVSGAVPSNLARPKSAIFTWPFLLSRMFSGLMSRWTTPSSCANCRAVQICVTNSKRLARLKGLIVEQMPQVHPIHIFHDEIIILAGLAKVINVHDARMIEFGQGLGFPSEAFGKGGMLLGFHRQDFQGHDSIQTRLAGFIDHAHAAHAEQFDDFQLRELRRQLGRVRRNASCRRGFCQRVDVDGGTRRPVRCRARLWPGKRDKALPGRSVPRAGDIAGISEAQEWRPGAAGTHMAAEAKEERSVFYAENAGRQKCLP
jgi:hypothetical protein